MTLLQAGAQIPPEGVPGLFLTALHYGHLDALIPNTPSHTHTHTPVARALGFDIFFPTGNLPQDPGLASSFTSLETVCHHFLLREISLDIYE